MRKILVSAVFVSLLCANATGVARAAYNSAIDALLAQAEEHIGQGDYDRADVVAQRIVRIDPDDGRGWALMATIREAQGASGSGGGVSRARANCKRRCRRGSAGDRI